MRSSETWTLIWHRKPEGNEWFRILVSSPVGAKQKWYEVFYVLIQQWGSICLTCSSSTIRADDIIMPSTSRVNGTAGGQEHG